MTPIERTLGRSTHLWVVIFALTTFAPLRLQASEDRNLLQVLETSGLDIDVFLQLLNEAQMTNKLANKGPWTILVPMNEAFSHLGRDFLEHLRAEEGRLRALVEGHILSSNVPMSRLQNDRVPMRTLLGDQIQFSPTSGSITVNGSKIVIADLKASNGVAHLIDKVIALRTDLDFHTRAPPSVASVIDLPEFSILSHLLAQGRLLNLLDKGGPFTLFAPTNEAFHSVSPFFVNVLESNQTLLRSVLLHHIVVGNVRFPGPFRSQIVNSVSGRNILLSTRHNGYFVNNSRVLKEGLTASNGIVHVLSGVILPPNQGKIIYPTEFLRTFAPGVQPLREAWTPNFVSLLGPNLFPLGYRHTGLQHSAPLISSPPITVYLLIFRRRDEKTKEKWRDPTGLILQEGRIL